MIILLYFNIQLFSAAGSSPHSFFVVVLSFFNLLFMCWIESTKAFEPKLV